jgi:hypothetical protein
VAVRRSMGECVRWQQHIPLGGELQGRGAHQGQQGLAETFGGNLSKIGHPRRKGSVSAQPRLLDARLQDDDQRASFISMACPGLGTGGSGSLIQVQYVAFSGSKCLILQEEPEERHYA